jgi:hypothetical protein
VAQIVSKNAKSGTRNKNESGPEHPHDCGGNRYTALFGASGDGRRGASGSEEAVCHSRDSRKASRQKAVPPRERASMRSKKSASSKNACRRAERSHQKLAEEFLARLDRTWRRHGREILDRVMYERPKLYFQAMVRLTVVLCRQLPEPPDFDRRHYRADVLQRLQQRAENARSGETIDGSLVVAASTLRISSSN